jgi:uncharacterized protein YndB with AHSA1/START domain
MIDIAHRIGIAAPAAKVYAALATSEGLSGWWTRSTRGISAPGGQIEFRFDSPSGERLGSFMMEVVALQPGRRVQWRCTAGPQEWVGTDLIFDLHEEGGYTIVRFGHRRWREAVEFMEHCSMKWATFLLSLKDLVETGQGRPAPADLKIDNWN